MFAIAGYRSSSLMLDRSLAMEDSLLDVEAERYFTRSINPRRHLIYFIRGDRRFKYHSILYWKKTEQEMNDIPLPSSLID